MVGKAAVLAQDVWWGGEAGAPMRVPGRRFLPVSAMVALVLAGAVLLATVIGVAAGRENDIARRASVARVKTALAAIEHDLTRLAADTAAWPDSHERLGGRLDRGWADANIGRWLHATFGVAATAVVDHDGRPVYLATKGKHDDVQSHIHLRESVADLVASARGAATGKNGVAMGYVMFDGWPALAAAAPILGERAGADMSSVLILARSIDEDVVPHLAASLGLNDLAFVRGKAVPGDPGAEPAAGIGPGVLKWSPDRPGDAFLRSVGPTAAAAFLLLSGLAWSLWLTGYRRYADVVRALERESLGGRVPGRAERRLLGLLDGLSEGVVVHREFRPLYVNRAFARVVGCRAVEDLATPGSLAPLLGGGDGNPLPPAEREYKACRADTGTEVWLAAHSFPLEWEDGPAVCTAVVDITAGKRAEAALRKANEQLHRAVIDRTVRLRAEVCERKKAVRQLRAATTAPTSRFPADMSRRLRIELNAILGHSDTIREQPFGPIRDARYREHVEGIHTAGSRLRDLLNDGLDLAMAEAGTMELVDGDVDLARMLAEAKAGGTVRLVTSVEGDLPMLWADERRVRQILGALLANAIALAPDGGEVRLHAGVDGSGGVVVTIAGDRGGTDGDGIALHLSRALAELHDAALEHHGAAIAVRFPPERTISAQVAMAESGSGHRQGTSPNGQVAG